MRAFKNVPENSNGQDIDTFLKTELKRIIIGLTFDSIKYVDRFSSGQNR